MNIKVRTNISDKYDDIEIVINSPVKDEQVQRLENKLLSETTRTIQKVIGMQVNNIFVINVLDIIVFYSEEKNNFCKTKDGVYRIKES